MAATIAHYAKSVQTVNQNVKILLLLHVMLVIRTIV